jgi:hypothetical protein
LVIRFDIEAREAALEIYHNLTDGEQKDLFDSIIRKSTSLEADQIKSRKEKAFGFQIKLRSLIEGKLPTYLQTFENWKKTTVIHHQKK